MSRRTTRIATAALALACGSAALGAAGSAPALTGHTSGSGAQVRNGRIFFSTGFLAPGGYDGTPQVYSVRPAGTGLRRLTHVAHGQAAGDPSVSRDGRRVAYVSNQAGDGVDLWTMTHRGHQKRRILSTPGTNYYFPSWSPNGKRLLVSACDTSLGSETSCDIVSVRRDGTHLRTLLADRRFDLGARYSPDGRRIEFQSDRHGYLGAIWVMPATGGKPRLVTPARLEAFVGFWSPSGHRIVFGDNCCQAHTNTWTISPSGRHLTRLTHVPFGHDIGFPTYSPDGRLIAAVGNPLGKADSRYDVVVMRADGSHLRTLDVKLNEIFLLSWGRVPAPRSPKGTR